MKDIQTTRPVALVTGASSGIGEATALALHEAGYTVYAAARRLERMKHLDEVGIMIVALDVTDEASVQAAVSKIEAASGSLDVLVNNAGYGSYGALEDMPMEEARRQFEVNVFGLARLTQLVLPGMRQSKKGMIINISSVGGTFGEALGVWYHATKYAVEGLSDSLALELKPFGIKVVSIEPGAIKTEWSGIAADNVLKTSGYEGGAYAAIARKKADSLRGFSDFALASPPKVVADGIVKIAGKRNPKLRYAIGGGAKSLMLARKLMSDRLFYRFLGLIIK